MKCFPKHYRMRILQLPDFSKGKLLGLAYAICLNGTLILSIFVQIKWNTVWFLIGVTIFVLSAALFIDALFHYAHTNPEFPVTTGVYRYTRNPQQIFAATMWIGVGVATTSCVMIALCILQLLLAYPTFRAQEKFCLERYGNAYKQYMDETGMYFGRRKRE